MHLDRAAFLRRLLVLPAATLPSARLLPASAAAPPVLSDGEHSRVTIPRACCRVHRLWLTVAYWYPSRHLRSVTPPTFSTVAARLRVVSCQWT